MIQGIRHIGLVVVDADKAVSFYRDLLGFEVYWDKVEEGEFIETISGLPSLKVRTIKMKAKNGHVLELLIYATHACPAGPDKLSRRGFAHMAVTVPDVDKIFALLKDKGAEFVSTPQISPDKKAKVCFCRDFEGNFLELVQDIG